MALVDAAVQFVNSHHQLMVRTHIAEFQFTQFFVGLYGGSVRLVNVGHDNIGRQDEDRIVALTDITVCIELHDLVLGVWY